MAGYLIKETTCEERKQIVEEALGNLSASCDGCMAGLADMYQDYIDGKQKSVTSTWNSMPDTREETWIGKKEEAARCLCKERRQRLFRRKGLEEEIGKKIRFDKGRCIPDDPDVYAADPGRKCISTAVFCCGHDHRETYPWF